MSAKQPFVSQSDRIKALCDEALRKPDITVTEKTFEIRSGRPSGETSRLKVSAMREAVEAAEAAVPEVATPARAEVVAEGGARVESPAAEPDKELAAMLDERDGLLKRKSGRVRMFANVALLVLFVTPVTVVAVSPTLRGEFENFVRHLQEAKGDVGTMVNAKEGFDDALAQVATRGDHIDAATGMLGVDPASVSAEDDLEMTAEMGRFMGDEADGFAVRRGKLQTMGRVATTVTGMEDTRVEK